jgi:hypothetical protein
MGHRVALRRIRKMCLGGLECFSLQFGYEGHRGRHLNAFWSCGGLWDAPASHFGLRDVVGVVLVTEMCLGVGAGSGIWQSRVQD